MLLQIHKVQAVKNIDFTKRKRPKIGEKMGWQFVPLKNVSYAQTDKNVESIKLKLKGANEKNVHCSKENFVDIFI